MPTGVFELLFGTDFPFHEGDGGGVHIVACNKCAMMSWGECGGGGSVKSKRMGLLEQANITRKLCLHDNMSICGSRNKAPYYLYGHEGRSLAAAILWQLELWADASGIWT